MAIGAAGSEDGARFAGEVTARESRAVGIHWAFAPVADVNDNPHNPVIHTRSFGEDPAAVSRLVAAFTHGLRDGGALSSAKHFPGHGDTSVDSHLALPVVDAGRERLDAVELAPFRAAVAAGVDSIMVGHLAVPALDPSGAPASLSRPLTEDLLRHDLGFDGLIVTDALEMKGVKAAWSGEAVIRAIQAGADVILMPDDARVAIRAIATAVAEGEISPERIHESARRVLVAKARVGLHQGRQVDRDAVATLVADPRAVEKAAALTRRSITVVADPGGVLPLIAESDPRVLHVTLTDRLAPRRLPRLAAELTRRAPSSDSHIVGPEVTEETIAEIETAAAAASHVIVSISARVATDEPALHASQRDLLDRLAARGRPLIVVAFESPYVLSEVPSSATLIATYGVTDATAAAVAAVLFGEAPAIGRLPVSLPGVAAVGAGLQLPARPMTLEVAAPETVGFRPDAMAEVDRLLEEFVAAGAFPGAVVAVGKSGKLVHLRAFGRHSYDAEAPAVTVDTRYDLASLTKVIATTTAAMILVDSGRLDLDAPVQAFLPRFVGPGKELVTVRHLLTHSSGIDWWAPLYEQVGDLAPEAAHAAALEIIQAKPLVAAPGEKTLYSDLGILLLGEIIERVTAEPFESYVSRRVLRPLGMTKTGYRPAPEILAEVAPTELDSTWRHRPVHGEVHDENAASLGGVAPHAGLFGTAPDLARFAQMLLNGGVLEHRRLVSRAAVDLFTRRAEVVEGSSRALGWDTKSPTGSSAGSLFSDRSFGHTGFTGTSIWIDPERDLFVILLTNRVHPTRDNIQIRQVRPAIADAVVRGLEGDRGPGTGEQGSGTRDQGLQVSGIGYRVSGTGAGTVSPTAEPPAPNAQHPTLNPSPPADPESRIPDPSSPVGATSPSVPGPGSPVPGPSLQTGLDRVATGEIDLLRGKRLGVIVHPASVTADGRHALDVFRDAGLDVVRIFSPEHGLRGTAAAGEKVADGFDETTGLPVVSLYGASRKPTREQLADLDLLVYDLQDAGVRFYTYVSTLILALEAAADADIGVVVLDRPNPLGGDLVTGPVAAPREQVPSSFVNLAPGPLVHGLTMGEMARLAAARMPQPPHVEVVAMQGWRRSMRWVDTGQVWIPPSPNLRSSMAALLYPGTALLEATNLSEGRGTEAPFQLIGAPWLDPAALELDLPGLAGNPVAFTPTASPGTGTPKHDGQLCHGLRLEVARPEAFDPYRLGLELLAQLRSQPGFAWARDGALTWLLGTAAPFAALEAGTPVAQILAADREDHLRWRRERRPFLLYW
jgi:uncharacterized protein YbbC (DUF1343 family)/CubicO group peptidase (beta-lactamase class C family)/beta-glucosidase-like glycosyl hydrolase